MIIGRILSPIHALGPGERVGLWTRGCSKRCPGCMSEDLWSFQGEQIPADLLARIIRQVRQQSNCTGLTISGGDPFEQASALYPFLKQIRGDFGDILVYTGFTLEEIRSGAAGAVGSACLDYIDVLIDGRYQRQQNHPRCALRGSSNQKIHFLNPDLAPLYGSYMQKGRIIETFAHNGQRIITGILNEEETP